MTLNTATRTTPQPEKAPLENPALLAPIRRPVALSRPKGIPEKGFRLSFPPRRLLHGRSPPAFRPLLLAHSAVRFCLTNCTRCAAPARQLQAAPTRKTSMDIPVSYCKQSHLYHRNIVFTIGVSEFICNLRDQQRKSAENVFGTDSSYVIL